MAEHFCRKTFAGFKGGISACTHLIKHIGIIGRIHNHTDKSMVLRRRTQHRRSADIDILDRFLVGHIRLGNRLRERIQIHHHQVDVTETKLRHLTRMLLVVTNSQQAAVYGRMKGFDPSVHNFREARYIGDADNRYAFISQKCASAACGDNFYAQCRQLAAKIHDALFVRYADQRSFDTHLNSPPPDDARLVLLT
ncbi:hypothetical protein D3C80_1321350 [compost metagenome]